MKIVYSEEASQDIEDAMFWFESKDVGLGRKFKSSLSETLDVIGVFPMAGRDIGRGLQVRISRKFSYKIAYRVKGSTITIVKIWHAVRNINP